MNLHNIKHLVAGGCSQTSDGIGGVPPSAISPEGGCSFVEQQGVTPAIPNSWASFVAKNLNVSSFVNLATGGHGNEMIASTMIDLLSRYEYDPASTLILFNVTHAHRLDIPCDFLHPDKSPFVPWTKELLPYSYLDIDCKIQKKIHENIGNEQVKEMTKLRLISLFNFLENQKFKYKFLFGDDFSNSYALNFLMCNPNRIDLEQYNNIREFALGNKVNKDSTHPNQLGHQMIANLVLQELSKDCST